MQLLCLWGAVTPIANLYTHVLLSQGKSNLYFYSTVCLGVFQLGGVCCMLSFGIYYMVLAFVIVNILWLFVWHYLVNRCIEFHIWDALKDVLPFCSITVGILSVTYFITKPIESVYGLLASKIIVAVVLYAACMHFSRSVIFKECISFVLMRK